MASRILLAEDEENIASFIERGLKESGYEVTVVPDGLAGWKQVRPVDFGHYYAVYGWNSVVPRFSK